MAYRGATPWHGLGQKVSDGASLETWLEEARMQWEIKASPVQYTNGSLHDYRDFQVLYRSDSNAPLSVVSDRYKVVQPKEMVEFFRSLVDREGFSIETLGSLKGGRRIWALARTNIEGEVLNGDRIKAYLLLITSCDGSLATTAKFISTRVVCWNTQAVALREGGDEVKVRHNTEFNADQVKGRMGLLGGDSFDSFMDRMRGFAKIKMTNLDADRIITSLLPAPSNPKTRIVDTKGYQVIMGLFNGGAYGSAIPGVQGTAWGLLNAVTEYTDHHVRAHSNENRLNSAWFGVGANLKAAAEEALLTM
ncbi:MAG: DUF932 domain-containing protein [Burkholderiaceae bacterium]|nr:MAG: DUF932 domain-containing protein [Burkholderiaceae bacterium]